MSSDYDKRLADYFVDQCCLELQSAELRLIGTTLTLDQAIQLYNSIQSLTTTMMHCIPPDQLCRATPEQATLLLKSK